MFTSLRSKGFAVKMVGLALLLGASAPVMAGNMSWFPGNYKQALTEAVSRKVPVVVEFSTDWCGYCKQAVPLFRELPGRLKPRGVATRVIVGMDTPEELADTAREYGPDTLLDPDNRIRVRGVPHLILSD